MQQPLAILLEQDGADQSDDGEIADDIGASFNFFTGRLSLRYHTREGGKGLGKRNKILEKYSCFLVLQGSKFPQSVSRSGSNKERVRKREGLRVFFFDRRRESPNRVGAPTRFLRSRVLHRALVEMGGKNSASIGYE